jgi:hypothetical protein
MSKLRAYPTGNHPKNCRTCRRVRKRREKEYAPHQPIRKGSVMYRRMRTFMPDDDFDAWMYKIQLGGEEPCLLEAADVPA